MKSRATSSQTIADSEKGPLRPVRREVSQCELLGIWHKLLLIRLFEEKIVELYPEQEMKTPVHLYIGQEAIAAGVCQALERSDYVFSNHRSHGHYLAKGGDLSRLAAELYGKRTGCASGKGGSMHVVDMSCGVTGTTAIVGGGIPLAVGAALASRIRKDGRVTVVFFGDGAADEGAFYESMAFAELKKLPIIFLLENNNYATCSPLSNRRSSSELYRLGEPHGMPCGRLDGNDAVEMFLAVESAVARARNGEGPSLIEAVTARWKGHVGPECDAEKGHRSRSELDAWKDRCPLRVFEDRYSGALKEWSKVRKDSESEIGEKIEEAFSFAKESPYPELSDLYTNVW